MKKRCTIIFGILGVAAVLANVLGVFSTNLGFRLTVTTSIYATLITILLTLLTLAVTAYVFLATALKERREGYEQETVRQMLKVRTNYLLILTILGIISLLSCFLIDNADCSIEFPTYLRGLTITGTSIVCILLFFYIYSIIAYEDGLVAFAHKARRKLFSPKSKGETVQDLSEVFKSIGDLEMLVMTLVTNHKDNFHSVDTDRKSVV